MPRLRSAKTRARIALALVLAVSVLMAKRELNPLRLLDFQVYLTAAELVHEHKSAQLYEEADTGRDPELRLANPAGLFAQTALRKGIPRIALYLYPPALADALVPLAGLTLRQASLFWIAFNTLCLLLTAALLVRLLKLRLLSGGALLLACCLFAFRPNLVAAYYGQITFVLLLLWTLGIYFYVTGRPFASAAMLAVATVFKLTPALFLLPMLLWKEWRWVRWYSACLAVCIAAMLGINGPATVADYLLHVLPAMSRGIPCVMNATLQSAIQVLYLDLHGANLTNEFLPQAPGWLVLLSKTASGVVLVLAMWKIHRLGKPATAMRQARVLAMVALLSACTAPVCWRHGYSIAFLALLFLWQEALNGTATLPALLLLSVTSVEYSFLAETVALKLVKQHAITHGPLLAVQPWLAPVLGLALVFFALHAMRQPPNANPAAS